MVACINHAKCSLVPRLSLSRRAWEQGYANCKSKAFPFNILRYFAWGTKKLSRQDVSGFKGGFKFPGGIPRKNGMGGRRGVIILWNGKFRHIILQNKTGLNMHVLHKQLPSNVTELFHSRVGRIMLIFLPICYSNMLKIVPIMPKIMPQICLYIMFKPRPLFLEGANLYVILHCKKKVN